MLEVIDEEQNNEGKDDDKLSYVCDTSFIQEFNKIEGLDTGTTNQDKSPFDDNALLDNPNPDFEAWDFHPTETDPPSQFTYSTHLESLRVSLNTFLRKPIKQPLSQNTKKALVSVSKSEVFSIDDHDYDFETQSIGNTLNKEYVKFVNKKHI